MSDDEPATKQQLRDRAKWLERRDDAVQEALGTWRRPWLSTAENVRHVVRLLNHHTAVLARMERAER